MLKLLGKRIIDSECRVFKQQWTDDYFFVQCKEKAVCLICKDTVAMFKEFNIRRNYETHHGEQYASLQGQVRRDKVTRLKCGLAAQQSTLLRQTQMNLASVRASFMVAKLIARCGKPFSDGEFVKKCWNGGEAEEVCPDKKDVLNAVSLSASTVTRRIEEMGDNVHAKLKEKAKDFVYFSLALDESNDVQDKAQLLIFIRGVSSNFEVTEELAAL